MRVLAQGVNFSQEQILEIADNKKEWLELFAGYYMWATYDFSIGAFEVDLIKVSLNGKGSNIAAIYDSGISEYLLGHQYIDAKEINL